MDVSNARFFTELGTAIAAIARSIWGMDLCNPVSGDFCRNRLSVFLFPARRQSIAGCGSFMCQQRSGDPAFDGAVVIHCFGAGL